MEPFQVAPQTWYVAGQTWVGCYLIDTGDGLILIDTAIPESLYLLVDSIYRLGFKLTDIKKILLSHAHFDHCGAAGGYEEADGCRALHVQGGHGILQGLPGGDSGAGSGFPSPGL